MGGENAGSDGPEDRPRTGRQDDARARAPRRKTHQPKARPAKVNQPKARRGTARQALSRLRPDVPLHRSLLLRLLALSVLVSVCSIGATAYVVVRTTAVAIREERGQALADDAKVYDTLLRHAATHRDWSHAGSTVRELAALTGHRIVLTSRNGSRTVADSDPRPGEPYRPPAKPTAVIDPLAVDPALLPDAADDRIDARAVGPFRLSRRERAWQRQLAGRLANCVRREGGDRAADGVRTGSEPSGRTRLTLPSGARSPAACDTGLLDAPTATERKALASLTTLVNTCLARRGEPAVALTLDGAGRPAARPVSPSSPAAEAGSATVDDGQAASCLAAGRGEQLAPYVASPVHLYMTSPERTASTFYDLSPGNKARIAGSAALVLLVTVAVSVLVGARLVRPLRALTHAARKLEDGGSAARVRVSGDDEIGRLAAAFNSMAERRAELEHLRKALVSDVAHELRTPLSNIRGWLEAAEDGVVPHDGRLLSSLLEEALLLQHIIDDLRDLSAADAGALRLARRPVDLTDTLHQTAHAHRAGADAAGVTLRVTAAEPSSPLHADPVRLRQTLGNLVSNALRHTPPGGTVTLTARQEGDEVAIAVQDTGPGLAPDELPHVFDRFWRAEKSRNRQTGGSGLGLSIARKLTEAHAGTLTAASAPGEGATFTLRLPLDPAPAPAAGPAGVGPAGVG